MRTPNVVSTAILRASECGRVRRTRQTGVAELTQRTRVVGLVSCDQVFESSMISYSSDRAVFSESGTETRTRLTADEDVRRMNESLPDHLL